MKNFTIKDKNNKEYWISRSMAVLAMVYTETEDKRIYILANKRGKGLQDQVGKWNMVAGYLDYNETIEKAASREVYEETGLVIPVDNWMFLKYDDCVKSNRQNVTMRFITKVDVNQMDKITKENSEKGEVDEVRWIDLLDINDYDWAFEHDKIINELFNLKLYEKRINSIDEKINKQHEILMNIPTDELNKMIDEVNKNKKPNKNEMTALEAMEIALKINTENHKNTLDKIIKEIKEESFKGNFELVYFKEINNELNSSLSKLGYKVSYREGSMNSYETIISWKIE